MISRKTWKRDPRLTPPEVARHQSGDRRRCTFDASLLDCPVCMHIVASPTFQCSKGHIICSSCKDELPNAMCPTCRDTSGFSRNYTLERLIESTSVQCENFQAGCTEAIKITNVREHMSSECKFRTVPCILSTCTTTVYAHTLLDHLQLCHGVQKIAGSLAAGSMFLQVPVTVGYFLITVHGISEVVFLLSVREWNRLQERTFYTAEITTFLNQMDAKKVKYSLSVLRRDGDTKISIEGSPESVFNPPPSNDCFLAFSAKELDTINVQLRIIKLL